MLDLIVPILAPVGAYFALIYSVFVCSVKRPPAFSLIRDQLYSIGVMSLPVVAITGFSTGMVLAAQAVFQLGDYGLEGATGLMVAKGMIVELGPVLTAFMVTGRVGASMCAELGTMRVSEQIDALKSMAVNPLRYLIAPRFISGIIMLPLLTIFSTVMGIVGGYMVAVDYYGMPANEFLDPLPQDIRMFDVLSGLTKAFMFGVVIITVSCFRGMNTTGGAAGVGRATTNSVVICYSIILILNFFMTVLINSSYEFMMRHFGRWLW